MRVAVLVIKAMLVVLAVVMVEVGGVTVVTASGSSGDIGGSIRSNKSISKWLWEWQQ